MLKTQAFVLDSAGGAGSMQLLGWMVPLQGPQKGELFTLAPVTSIGTDPTAISVLIDKFMSEQACRDQSRERHVGVARRGLDQRDLRQQSPRRSHELVDNDFIKFGAAML